MKKVTELTVSSFRTVHSRDEYGNLIRGTEDIVIYRNVNVIGNGIKFAHFIIDLICFQVVLKTAMFLLDLMQNKTGFNSNVNLTIEFVSFILALLAYPALYAFCEYKWQRTPAKYLTKSVVVDEYGNKPELRTIILRSMVRLVPFEPVSCLGEPSSGWHDRWSNTLVIPESELVELKRLQLEQSTAEVNL